MSLARQGRVKEAESTIVANGALPTDPLSLEVLAVIVTAGGDYGRGLQIWRQLLQLDPKHAEAKRMIACIELWLSRPPWARYVPAGLATLVAILVVGLFLALTWEPESPTPARSTANPVTPAAHPNPAPRPAGANPAPTVPGVNFNPQKSQSPQRPR